MIDLVQPAYSAYARQRLFRILFDLTKAKKDLNWSSMADAIGDWRNVDFQRNNFYRLKKGTLGNSNIEIIVQWIEETYDSEIRERLKPQAIFDEFGQSGRDYYFHIPTENVLNEWDEQLLEDFAGVYLCAPKKDPCSYLPLSIIRQWCADKEYYSHLKRDGYSPDIKQYISERSILVLQHTPRSYFYAAEFPLSMLLPRELEIFDNRMVYEGVGIISSNSIHVQLRECLARVPKTHSILIREKTRDELENPAGLSLHLPLGFAKIQEEWEQLSEKDISFLKKEYQLSIEAEHFLTGPAQISVSPIPFARNRIHLNFHRDYIYHRKPSNFLHEKESHFILPEVISEEEIKKIIDNPLSIGELL